MKQSTPDEIRHEYACKILCKAVEGDSVEALYIRRQPTPPEVLEIETLMREYEDARVTQTILS